MDANIVDNSREHRFELPVGDAVAVAYYEHEGGRIVLTHTEVPQELSDRGIGSKLAKGVFEHLRSKGSRVVAKCPFMAGYAARHPEYAAMLDG
jgi:predicted GNAT family acetyltransferase